MARAPLWYVTATWAGDAAQPLVLRSGLLRLTQERPFLSALRFTTTSAQVEYWDEGASLDAVARLAARLWDDHRASCGLPDWELVALEVVSREERSTGGSGPHPLANAQELDPLSL